MRIGGVGSGNVHTADSHQVTNCVHVHKEQTEKTGRMDALLSSAQNQKQQTVASELETMDGFSLVDGIKRLLSRGRHWFGRIWNGAGEELQDGASADRVSEDAGMLKPEEARDMALREDMAGRQEASSVVNPHFVPIVQTKGADSLWQRFALKVHTATGYLAKKFGRETSMQTGVKKDPKQSQEQMRRHSRYRDGQEEIDCVITDDSYLMDSYDKTGKYVKLGQESGRRHN